MSWHIVGKCEKKVDYANGVREQKFKSAQTLLALSQAELG